MRILIRARRRPVIAVFLIFLAGLGVLGFIVKGPVTQTTASIKTASIPEPAVHVAATQIAEEPILLASPGRIEGASDTLEVGAAMDGVVQSIHVREGQKVASGQVLAELDCRELQSALPVAKSEAESLRQVKARLLLGSRTEERRAAAEQTARAKAVLAHATNQLERQRQLAEAQAVSRQSFDDAKRDAAVAETDYQHALRNEELVNAGPLAEEVAKADADLQAAERRIGYAEEKLDKCKIRAPVSGTVLRIILHQGESFALVSPRPVLTMADISGRRVRAEVDERDVSKVHVGQEVLISSEAYSRQQFKGKVTRIATLMGRKSVITGDPADKSDRDILEVTAELEHAAIALPVGLRTTVQFHR